MKLKRFLLRYYPPGIILEFVRSNQQIETKYIDLLNLTPDTDVEALINQILMEEPAISSSKRPHLRKLIQKLMEKLYSSVSHQFQPFRTLKAHILPLTNCGFNKSGDKFITASYDRTCKVWDTISGSELLSLEGHHNVVYTIAFNTPYGDRIGTGSFDNTAKLWDSNTGTCYYTLRGHQGEIVCLNFDTNGFLFATGSMDQTAKLWDCLLYTSPSPRDS